MATGKHFHHFNIVLKTVIKEVEIGSFNTQPKKIREQAIIWKECDCGCINKTEMLVTHKEGRAW